MLVRHKTGLDWLDYRLATLPGQLLACWPATGSEALCRCGLEDESNEADPKAGLDCHVAERRRLRRRLPLRARQVIARRSPTAADYTENGRAKGPPIRTFSYSLLSIPLSRPLPRHHDLADSLCLNLGLRLTDKVDSGRQRPHVIWSWQKVEHLASANVEQHA